MPLAFQPGSEWNYGVSTDVLGRLVEVGSGMALDEFLRTRISIRSQLNQLVQQALVD